MSNQYDILPNEQMQKTNHSSNRYPHRKKCNYCLTFSFISIILLFFLYPRKPSIYLEEIKFSDSFTSGKFKLKNHNFYNIKWTDPNFSLYWIPYEGQVVGKMCYNNNTCSSSNLYNNVCAIKLGQFKANDVYKTNAKKSKDIELPITSSSQEIACSAWMILNPYKNLEQFLSIKGNIKAKSKINNFGKLSIPKTYYYI